MNLIYNAKIQSAFFLFILTYWCYLSQRGGTSKIIPFVVVSTIFFTLACRLKNALQIDADFIQKSIKVFIIFYLLHLVGHPRVFYVDSKIAFRILALAAALPVFLSFFKRFNEKAMILSSITLLFFSKILLLLYSGLPHIDVFTSNTDAAKYFLQGLNPYAQTYRDIYNGSYDYPPGFAYWPAVLLVQSIGQIVGDIRISHLLCDALSAFFLFKIIAKYQHKAVALLAVLFWFAMPIQNFHFQEAWIDTILITGFLGSFFFLLEKRIIVSGIVLGFFVAVKQYAGFYPLILGMALIGQKNYRDFLKLSLSAMATFLLIMLPFLLSAPDGFITMTIKVPLESAFRSDSFSLTALFFHYYEKTPPTWVYSLPIFTMLPLCMIFSFKSKSLEKSLLYIMMCYFFVFALSKQAFVNYWYYTSIFMFTYIFCHIISTKKSSPVIS